VEGEKISKILFFFKKTETSGFAMGHSSQNYGLRGPHAMISDATSRTILGGLGVIEHKISKSGANQTKRKNVPAQQVGRPLGIKAITPLGGVKKPSLPAIND